MVGILGIAAVLWMVSRRQPSTAGDAVAHVLLSEVVEGAFIHDIAERGEIESSNSVEVRSAVKTRTESGAKIRKIVPEGTQVQAGDVLVELDDSALRDELIEQQINCNTSQALLTEAEYALKIAETTLVEYQEGVYRKDLEALQAEIATAEENVRRAKEYLIYSQTLARGGFVTQVQLDSDAFAVEKAQNEASVARTKLHVLETYTYRKQVDTFTADVETSKIKVSTEKKSHDLELGKLKLIEDQIQACVIKAPAAGQVVYANQNEPWNPAPVIIEEGATVREGQLLIRLPDPLKMHVKAKTAESQINQVQAGLVASVELDAFPELRLQGKISKVDAYPMAGSWLSSNAKEFSTTVEIEHPPPGLRTGMTARVTIHVERLASAVQVPVQAVLDHGGAHYCLLHEGETLKARPVQIGSTNEKHVVIRQGLQAGEKVVVNPRKYLGQVVLPDSPAVDVQEPSGLAGADSSGTAKPAQRPKAPRRATG